MSLISFGKDAAGQDALVIAGHPIPMSVLAIGAAGVGTIVVLKARSSGSNVVSAGTTPATTTTDDEDGDDADLADVSDAVTELSSELSTLQSQVQSLGTPPASTVPTTSTTPARQASPPAVPTKPTSASNNAGVVGNAGSGSGKALVWPGSAAGSGGVALSTAPPAVKTPPLAAAVKKVAAAVTVKNLNPTPSPKKTPAQTTQIVHSVPTSEKDASIAVPTHSPVIPHSSPATSEQLIRSAMR